MEISSYFTSSHLNTHGLTQGSGIRPRQSEFRRNLSISVRSETNFVLQISKIHRIESEIGTEFFSKMNPRTLIDVNASVVKQILKNRKKER